MLLLIDNYDSFTYNVYQLLAELGAEVEVVRNDKITVEQIETRGYAAVVISPGPGRPDEAGISKDVIRHFAGKLPILGICLGHQAIGEAFGGRVVLAAAPIHGKVSLLCHDGRTLYEGLTPKVPVGRYHSLIIERSSLPECLEISAELEDGTIMGVRHKEYDIEGLQFHPESILTPDGKWMLQNFLRRIHV